MVECAFFVPCEVIFPSLLIDGGDLAPLFDVIVIDVLPLTFTIPKLYFETNVVIVIEPAPDTFTVPLTPFIVVIAN